MTPERLARLRRYVLDDRNQLEGWFYRLDAEIFSAILCGQADANCAGAVAEIGVHHGKCFILMCLGLQAGEKAYAIDVFGDHHLNIDGSGRGDRAILEKNCARFHIDPNNLVIDARSSLEVKPADLLNRVGEIRFFSVDGGHWLEIVQNDLRLAEHCLANRGVIVLDDFHRPEWPDVSAGYVAWYREKTKPIVPFAIGLNKLYLCTEEWVASYKDLLARNEFLQQFLVKKVVFQGHEVPVYQRFVVPDLGFKRRFFMDCFRLYNPGLYAGLKRWRKKFKR
jgi:hypothetical protein